MRACEQLNELFLRKVCLRTGGLQNFLKGLSRVVEQLGGGRDCSEGVDYFLPRRIQFALRNLSLAGEDLPESNIRLKSSEGIPAQSLIGNLVDHVGRIHEQADACIVQGRKLSEHQIPTVEF